MKITQLHVDQMTKIKRLVAGCGARSILDENLDSFLQIYEAGCNHDYTLAFNIDAPDDESERYEGDDDSDSDL